MRIFFLRAIVSWEERRNEEDVTDELTLDVAEARRRFDLACGVLRPDLHRFCTRMTGSPCDGEDVLQDALVLAFYRLSELRDLGSLRAWLFRIAHNKCIDFLRGRTRFTPIDEEGLREEPTMNALDETLDHKRRAEQALANIVTELPPKERACIVLKDVLDCSLEETAAITGSNIGAVKAALHRGREKLERAQRTPAPTHPFDAHRRAIFERYLAAFNGRDWDGVRALLADEARLEVVHRSEGPAAEAPYFANYARLGWQWKLAFAWVDCVESIVHFRRREAREEENGSGAWIAHTIVQLHVEGDRIAVIRDFIHVEDLLRGCAVISSFA